MRRNRGALRGAGLPIQSWVVAFKSVNVALQYLMPMGQDAVQRWRATVE